MAHRDGARNEGEPLPLAAAAALRRTFATAAAADDFQRQRGRGSDAGGFANLARARRGGDTGTMVQPDICAPRCRVARTRTIAGNWGSARLRVRTARLGAPCGGTVAGRPCGSLSWRTTGAARRHPLEPSLHPAATLSHGPGAARPPKPAKPDLARVAPHTLATPSPRSLSPRRGCSEPGFPAARVARTPSPPVLAARSTPLERRRDDAFYQRDVRPSPRRRAEHVGADRPTWSEGRYMYEGSAPLATTRCRTAALGFDVAGEPYVGSRRLRSPTARR